MFPLRDTVRSRSTPLVTWMLIGINVLVFLFQSSLGPRASELFLRLFGLVPARLSLLHPASWVGLFSSIFLHGSWIHLISNMWTLFIFGDNVEDRMGAVRYLTFYTLGGAVAGLTHVTFAPHSPVPTVGASGAIAAVLGAYFVLFPGARVVTLIPWFFFPWLVDIPAFFYLGIWFLSQVSSGVLSLGAPVPFGGIAWWAHIGGFVFGALLVRLFVRRPHVLIAWHHDERWP